jgi:hypothetical protein
MLVLFAKDYTCLGYDQCHQLWNFERKFNSNSDDYERVTVRRAKMVDKSNRSRTIYESDGSTRVDPITVY